MTFVEVVKIVQSKMSYKAESNSSYINISNINTIRFFEPSIHAPSKILCVVSMRSSIDSMIVTEEDGRRILKASSNVWSKPWQET